MVIITKTMSMRVVYFLLWGGVAISLYHYGLWTGWSGWIEGWHGLYIPAMYPPFADLRGVQASLHALDIGLNPQIENPTDVLQRPLNYPSIWINIARLLHLDNENTYLIFCSLIGVTYILLCSQIFLKSGSFVILPVFFSGASLLAVERGNNDLIIFSLLYVACNAPRIIGAIIYSATVGLKIFPFFGIFSFYKNGKLLLFLMMISLIIFYFIWPEIKLIKAATPVAYFLSYGSPSISALIKYKWGINLPHYFISAVIIFGVFYLRYNKWMRTELIRNADDKIVGMFIMGASIYIGTFIFNSNFDYRLIFLIFCLPFVTLLINKTIQIALLIMIILASNEWILEQHLAGSLGYLICLLSKIGILLILSNILLDLFIELIPTCYMPRFIYMLIRSDHIEIKSLL